MYIMFVLEGAKRGNEKQGSMSLRRSSRWFDGSPI